MVYATWQSSSHWRWAIQHLQDLDTGTMCQVLQCKWLYSGVHNQINNDINNHRSRSCQGEGHLINSLQGIWRRILQENPHKITALSTIRSHHQTQGLVHIPTSQGLSTQPHRTSSLQRVHWRTSQDRENLPLKIPPSGTLFLCQKKESGEIAILPRLSVSQ